MKMQFNTGGMHTEMGTVPGFQALCGRPAQEADR